MQTIMFEKMSKFEGIQDRIMSLNIPKPLCGAYSDGGRKLAVLLQVGEK